MGCGENPRYIPSVCLEYGLSSFAKFRIQHPYRRLKLEADVVEMLFVRDRPAFLACPAC